jgi:Asp/Glu/hydantoin racemase
MGNALTWPFPVLYKVVRDASPDRVVRRNAEGLLDAFIASGRELVADGADGITTNCGFLSVFQSEISAALNVPVATSSLMQVSMVAKLLPDGQRPGILTVCGSTLSETHLVAAGVDANCPIETTEDGSEFTRFILGNEPQLDVDMARQDNIDAALRLKADHPDVGAIVLECTNMIPFASDIRRATGLPVFSMLSFVSWFQSSLDPKVY